MLIFWQGSFLAEQRTELRRALMQPVKSRAWLLCARQLLDPVEARTCRFEHWAGDRAFVLAYGVEFDNPTLLVWRYRDPQSSPSVRPGYRQFVERGTGL